SGTSCVDELQRTGQRLFLTGVLQAELDDWAQFRNQIDAAKIIAKALTLHFNGSTPSKPDIFSRYRTEEFPGSNWSKSTEQFLYLGGMCILSIPPCIGFLNKLNGLDLQGGEILWLPQELRFLDKLTYLNLRNNFLAGLPRWFGNLRSLKELHLLDNEIFFFPEVILDCSELETLSISAVNLN